MKAFLFICLSLLSFSAPAAVLVEAQYNAFFHAENSYKDSTGTKSERSNDLDLRFFTLGGRYIFEEMGSPLFNAELSAAYKFPALNEYAGEFSIFQIGAGGSLNLGDHHPLLSLEYGKFETKDSPLNYKPDFGLRVGYRYNIGLHSITAAISWMRVPSDNKPTVNDQLTVLTGWTIGYGYQVF